VTQKNKEDDDMQKPYQSQIDALQKDLCCHEYIARKAEQECHAGRMKEFREMSADIRKALVAMRHRQEAVIAEWKLFTVRERRELLAPLVHTVEEIAGTLKDMGCPEMSAYFDHAMTNYILDLIDTTNYEE